MWDALVAMMNVAGFWELKRTRTERPELGPARNGAHRSAGSGPSAGRWPAAVAG